MVSLTRKRKTLNRVSLKYSTAVDNEATVDPVDDDSEEWASAISLTEAKRSVQRMASELKDYIEAEMSSSSWTEESPLLELVASTYMSRDAFNPFAYERGACPGEKAIARRPNNESYKSAMLLLGEYRAAAREYGQLSEDSSTARMPSWLRWEKDSADLHELNQRMLAMATTFVQHQVVPRATETQPGVGKDDVEQIAWELLEDAHHVQQGAETWGNVAEAIMQNMCNILALLS
ncbi:hypothetical protein E4U53_001036 [Claviceps sorghi]|nr:hypothetical protein E4U53_001036 [Claviceps sorghi]